MYLFNMNKTQFLPFGDGRHLYTIWRWTPFVNRGQSGIIPPTETGISRLANRESRWVFVAQRVTQKDKLWLPV